MRSDPEGVATDRLPPARSRVEEEELVALGIDSLAKLDILSCLLEQPETIDRAEGIAVWSGVTTEAAAEALAGLVDAGLVRRLGSAETPLYGLARDPRLGEALAAALAGYRRARGVVRSSLAAIEGEAAAREARLRRRVERSESLADRVLDASRDAFFVVGPEGELERVNRAGRAWLREELRGQPGTPAGRIAELLVEPLAERVERVRRAALAQAPPAQLNDRFDVAAGQSLEVEARLLDHETPTCVIALRDVTMRERLGRLHLHMVDAAATELAEPLRRLAAALAGGSSPQVVALVRRLEERLAALIAAARQGSSALVPAFERVELGPFMEAVAGALRHRFGLRSVRLSLVQPPPGIAFRADPLQLGRVVEELLRRALELTPDGGVVQFRALRRSVGVDRPEVILAIDGPAPPGEAMDETGPALARPAGERGLWYELCRALVEAQGGSLRSGPSPDGQGYTRRLVFPIEP